MKLALTEEEALSPLAFRVKLGLAEVDTLSPLGIERAAVAEGEAVAVGVGVKLVDGGHSPVGSHKHPEQ